mgnify:CR=1 FL=1
MTVPNQKKPNSYRMGPDARGHFGIHGGRFVAEIRASVEAAFSRLLESVIHVVPRALAALAVTGLTVTFVVGSAMNSSIVIRRSPSGERR